VFEVPSLAMVEPRKLRPNHLTFRDLLRACQVPNQNKVFAIFYDLHWRSGRKRCIWVEPSLLGELVIKLKGFLNSKKVKATKESEPI
jgi:hypothetical protein